MTNPTDEWCRCRCYKCKRVMAAGEPVWRKRAKLGPSMFGNGWRHGIEYFCRQCAGDIYAHSEGKCAFCKREIYDCAHQGWRCPRYYYCSYRCRRLLPGSLRRFGLSAPRLAARHGNASSAAKLSRRRGRMRSSAPVSVGSRRIGGGEVLRM
jgi:hypothetical protein